MPADFSASSTARASCASTTFCGLVFGSFARRAADRGVSRRRDRSAALAARAGNKPVEVIGRFTQALPNNWKLYVENVRDTYHASLLHLFFTTFRINRLSQGGGVIVEPRRRPPRQLHDRIDRGAEQRRLRRADCAPTGRVPPRRSQRARDGRRVRRRHHAADPVGRSRASCCSRSTTPRGAPGRAARRRRDRAELDLFRLRRRHAGDDRAPPEAANLVGPAGYHLDGGRLRSAASCSAASRRAGGRAVGRRDGRQRGREAGDARVPRCTKPPTQPSSIEMKPAGPTRFCCFSRRRFISGVSSSKPKRSRPGPSCRRRAARRGARRGNCGSAAG